MSKLYSGAEIVFKCLEDQDVEFIFGYPGGAVNLPIYDELKNFNSVKHILVRHEQGAGHARNEGYARSSGKPGVLLVTSGPRSNKCSNCFNRCLYGLSSYIYIWFVFLDKFLLT